MSGTRCLFFRAKGYRTHNILVHCQRLVSCFAVAQNLPLVERHTGGTTSVLTNPLGDEGDSDAGSETSSEREGPEAEDAPSTDWPTEPQVRPTPSLPLWQVMGSPTFCHARDLQIDETRLQECQARLEKLSSLESRVQALESRVQALERDTAGKVFMDREQWENLESRVLLLETRLALSSAQVGSCHLPVHDGEIGADPHPIPHPACFCFPLTFPSSLMCFTFEFMPFFLFL